MVQMTQNLPFLPIKLQQTESILKIGGGGGGGKGTAAFLPLAI